MTYEQIAEMMEEMGLPFAYQHFAEGESPAPPFLLFLSPGENTFSADNCPAGGTVPTDPSDRCCMVYRSDRRCVLQTGGHSAVHGSVLTDDS